MTAWFPKWLIPIVVLWAGLRSSIALKFAGDNYRTLLIGAKVLDFVLAAGLIVAGYGLYKYLRFTRRLSGPRTRGGAAVAPSGPLVAMPTSTPVQPVVARPCPNCGTNLNPLDKLCFYCRTPLEPWFQRNGFWWRHTDTGDQWLDQKTMQWREWEQV